MLRTFEPEIFSFLRTPRLGKKLGVFKKTRPSRPTMRPIFVRLGIDFHTDFGYCNGILTEWTDGHTLFFFY